VLVASLAVFAGSEPPVKVQISPGQRPRIRVWASGDSVVLANCRGVVWQMFDEASGDFTSLEQPECDSEAVATWVGGFEQRPVFYSEAPEDLKGAKVVRALLVGGVGGDWPEFVDMVKAGDGSDKMVPQWADTPSPFVLSGCEELFAVKGPTISVKGGADESVKDNSVGVDSSK